MGAESSRTDITWHRRNQAVGGELQIEQWRIDEYEQMRLAKVVERRPMLKPLHQNELYYKRMKKFEEITVEHKCK